MSLPWKSVSDESQLDNLDSLTLKNGVKAVLFFKHSPRCIISIRALSRFEEVWAKTQHNIPLYLINVLENRNVSNWLADKYRVTHESPQVLLVKNGICIHHNSHTAVDAEEISTYL